MTSGRTQRRSGVVLLALVLVAVNLRAALTSVPSVVLDIQRSTGWGDVALGLLTTLPVVTMGLFALAVPTIAARIGRSRAVWAALALLTLALVARLAGTVPGVLHLSVIAAGVGIALVSGLVPGLVREQLPSTIGSATGAWTAAMFLGAGAAAALTVPLANLTGSWEEALAVWAIPAAIAVIAWGMIERPRAQVHEALARVRLSALPWRNRAAWSLTAYMAINSLVYYAAIAWVAASLDERGYSEEAAGWLFGLLTVSQVAAALTLPAWGQRVRHRRLLIAATAVVTAISLVSLGVDPTFMTVLVMFAIGASNSGGFTISLSMLSEFTSDAEASARLTAMAFTVTYLVAALGPVAAGAVIQLSDSWTLVFCLLAVVALAQLIPITGMRRGTVID